MLPSHLFRRLLVGSFILTCHFAFGQTQPSKVLITTGDWPPYNGKDLPGGGIANALVQAAFCEVGIEVEFGWFPWSRSLKLAIEGSWQASSVWAFTPDRAKDLVYSDPLVAGEDVLYHLEGTRFDWQEIDDLRAWKIGGTIGYSYPGLRTEKGDFQIHLERAPSDLLNFRKLLAGRIQVFIADRWVGDYILNHHFSDAERARIVRHPKAITTIEYYLVFSKKHKSAASLVQAFNRGLASLKAHQDPAELVQLIENSVRKRPERAEQ